MQNLTYSIIIPAYNESARLPASLEAIQAFISEQHLRAEILVVNDGSTDDTAEVVRRCASSNGAVRLLDNPGNHGKGYSVRNGMMNAAGDVLLFTDADLSSPITEAPKLFAAIQQGADVAIGSRWLDSDTQTQRQPFYRQLLGRLFNFTLQAILGLHFKDTQCGFKAFTRSAARQLFPFQRVDTWGFDPELLFIAKKFTLRVTEVPVEWAHEHGSKLRVLRDGAAMLGQMLAIRWNDLCGRYERAARRVAASR